MLAFAGSVGGIATPVGTPPNLIGIALIAEGLQVRILDTVKAGIVIDVVGILLVWAVANWLVPVVLGR